MKIFVPHFRQLEPIFGTRQEVVFYNALRTLPEIGGGRGGTEVAQSVLRSTDELKRMSEQYGERFQLLANGSNPMYTAGVKKVCEILDRNHSSIIVSQFRFARELKDDIPTLAISASCIMSFYRRFQDIMTSDVFERVCAPQFWNYNIQQMCDNVPQEMRHRVYYIVNSPCVWSMGCRNHYDVMTATYTHQYQPVPLQLTWHATCRRKLDLPPMEWGRGVFETLFDNGFTAFKFQGRDKPVEILAIRLKEALDYVDKAAT